MWMGMLGYGVLADVNAWGHVGLVMGMWICVRVCWGMGMCVLGNECSWLECLMGMCSRMGIDVWGWWSWEWYVRKRDTCRCECLGMCAGMVVLCWEWCFVNALMCCSWEPSEKRWLAVTKCFLIKPGGEPFFANYHFPRIFSFCEILRDDLQKLQKYIHKEDAFPGIYKNSHARTHVKKCWKCWIRFIEGLSESKD